MNITTMLASLSLMVSTLSSESMAAPSDGDFIRKQSLSIKDGRLTPEALWAMGRLGDFSLSPDGKLAVYSVSYYSVEQNKSHSVLYTLDMVSKENRKLTTTSSQEMSPVFVKEGKRIVFLSSESGSMQLWEMNADGSDRKQISNEPVDVQGFLFSPDEKKVLLVKEVPQQTSIQANDADLPLSSGMVCNDLMYKHWDTYVKSAPHPFVATYDGQKITGAYDILKDEPFESPMMPFGGIEQLAWSQDGNQVAYTCRKKSGLAYAISTDSDIYLYDVNTQKSKNICKPDGYTDVHVDPTRSLENQQGNPAFKGVDCNLGYDQNPSFSPDGKYIAWLSMERDGYESDRTRLCVYELATGKKFYVTESFESGVNEFCWLDDSKQLYFTGVWHGRTHVYRTDLEGKVEQLTEGDYDYSLVGLGNQKNSLLLKRHSMSAPDDVYHLTFGHKGKKVLTQLTFENEHILKQLVLGEVKERWVNTVDGKQELCWVIYPPHFNPDKKYPTLLFCEGGPQSPVSQFWSYRWNFQLMAANDYIIIAPNRRGLPGFGMEWLEQISGDYSGLCMQDYLSAIDDICKEKYVDKDRLGAVGASFGGYSVYWLAGNHNKRFKAFIAHDGIFNTQQQYVETEELWFPNWDMKAAPWHKDSAGARQKVFETSPHLYVDKWDTPILCIHGQKDFRIEYTQAESAFTAARLRGIPAQLLLFPDENHWVLKPQNGILWQRTFFRWLDRWLKK